MTGFGLVTIKGEGTPIHPIEMTGWTPEQYDRQLLAYFDYWRARKVKSLHQHPEYARYKTLRADRGRKDHE